MGGAIKMSDISGSAQNLLYEVWLKFLKSNVSKF
jgi:hypothetical protein